MYAVVMLCILQQGCTFRLWRAA